MMYQNHVIDPTFFFDAIEEFSFNYNLFVVSDVTIDDDGMTVYQWEHHMIRGSFQRDAVRRKKDKSGSTDEATSNFYCKSLYRINIGDVLEYHDTYYVVNSVNDYDEYGVRECSLEMTQLVKHRDLADYVQYLRGEKLI